MTLIEDKLEIAGQVVGGDVAEILIREKSGKRIELGDLLVAEEDEGTYLILKVFDLGYGSQIPQSARELAAGLRLEGYGSDISFIDPKLRNYTLVSVRAVARVSKGDIRIPKVLPTFFSDVRYATKKDLDFLAIAPENPVYLGKIRSGSKVMDIDVYLNGVDFFTHHVFIPATTGRGKSNLIKVMLWSTLEQARFGILVLDAHDEYYGRDGPGLKDHSRAKSNLRYYTLDAPTGTNSLVINLSSVNPGDFDGIVSFTDAQDQAITLYHDQFGERWIENIVRGTDVGAAIQTVRVLQRKMRTALGVYEDGGDLVCDSDVFSTSAGSSTVEDIVKALESGKVVIIDTSRLSDEAELLIGSIISNKVFYNYRACKARGTLKDKPPVSIVIEEAPRVLSKEKMEQGDNIYSTIAREGRKFKVGLVGIAQLTSVIPTMVLTNMCTKIILGNEMASERKAIIDSAAQDLSTEDRTIASLDKGEGIVSSIFTKFAVPIYTPLFEDIAKRKPDDARVQRLMPQ